MAELLLIAVAAATIDNFVLARLLGLSPVLAPVPAADPAAAASRALKTGLATTVVLAVSVGLGQQLNHWILLPWHLPFLRILGLLLVASVTIAIMDWCLRRRAARSTGAALQLPFASVQSLVLGVTLLATASGDPVSVPGGSQVSSLTGGLADSLAGDTLTHAIALGLGAGLGFTLVICAYSGLRARLERNIVPRSWRGPAIAMLTLAIMALAFSGFSGIGPTGSGG
ncbi:MAG: hypothetical protein DYH20_06240 [Gammaproteobacteria bacterium PRO9]|nr:hypothetical protein [Gammaproteobacteria bacterium PRO9]